jgi:hypothetical protein
MVHIKASWAMLTKVFTLGASITSRSCLQAVGAVEMPGGRAHEEVHIAAGIMAGGEALEWRKEKEVQGCTWKVVNVAIDSVDGHHNA